MDNSGHIKLTDFGLAKENTKFTEGADSWVGTPAYFAPEMLDHRQYGFEVDLWALGIFIYELLTGTTPFYHRNKIFMFKKIMKEDIVMP